jgi:uncharacterized protein YneF (UPF0154 family)
MQRCMFITLTFRIFTIIVFISCLFLSHLLSGPRIDTAFLRMLVTQCGESICPGHAL